MSMMPKFEMAGRYDGSVPAARWLAQVEYDFEMAGHDTPPTSLFLRVFRVLLVGEPATRIESHAKIQNIIKNRATATPADLEFVTDWLCTQFPTDAESCVPEADVLTEVSELAQHGSESLLSYYNRAMTLLKRTDTKDKPRGSDVEVSGNDKFILDSLVNAFIRGLHDARLRDHVLDRDVLGTSCMWRAYETVLMSHRTLAAKDKVNAELAKQQQFKNMEEFIYTKCGMPANVAMAANANLAHEGRYTSLPPATQMMTANNTYGVGSNGNGMTSGSGGTASRVGNNDGGNANGGGNASNTAQSYKPWNNSGARSGYGNNNYDSSAYGNNSNYNKGYSNANSKPPPPITPASDSKNPIINGSEPYDPRRDGPLCIGCGIKGHTKSNCGNPPLPPWERAYLRSLVYPDTPLQAHMASISAEYQYVHGPGAREPPFPSGDARNATKASSTSSAASTVHTPGTSTPGTPVEESMTFEQFTSGTSGRGRNNTYTTYATPSHSAHALQSDTLSYRAIDSDTENGDSDFDNSHASALMAPYTGTRKKRQRVQDSAESESAHGTVPIKTSKRKTREGNVGFEEVPDGTIPAVPVASTVKKTARKTRELREIVGREGEGPVDYKDLAGRFAVSMSLLDLMQVSPEVSKQFRKLSTRVNRKGKKARTAPDEIPTTAAKAAKHVSFASTTHRSSNTAKVIPKEPITGTGRVAPKLHPDEKAFKVPAVVKVRAENGGVARVHLPIGMTQADQGADMSIMSPKLHEKLGYPLKTLKSCGFADISIGTADGGVGWLSQFCEFEIGVLGIWRTVHCFVRPPNGPHDVGLDLLLGLPWLHDVDSKIDVRSSSITLGDANLGETVQRIEGPIFVPAAAHKLILQPAKLTTGKLNDLNLHFAPGAEDDSDADDTTDDSDSDGAYDSEATSNDQSNDSDF